MEGVYVLTQGVDTGDVFQLGTSFHNAAGWETRRIDLSEYAGLSVRIGFYFDTWDAFNPPQVLKEGWYIDDVRVVRSQTINTPRTTARPDWRRYQ